MTLAYSFYPKLQLDKLHHHLVFLNRNMCKKLKYWHHLTLRFNHRFNVIYIPNTNKITTKLNNHQKNAFSVVSTKTGSSETTTITVKDIISSNLSYSQSNFNTIISPANFYYAVLTGRKDLRSKKFVTQKRISPILTVKVETQGAQHICKSQTNIKALPAISQNVNINGI